MLKVLVLSHSHPRLTNGGAEIAALQLATELSSSGTCRCWFLGCNLRSSIGRDGVAITQPFSDDEYLYDANGEFSWFSFSNRDSRLPKELHQLVVELDPDIVHLHHYVNFGVDILYTLRRAAPNAAIIITLHEYLAICHHFGQMVKTSSLDLCYEASPIDCHKCFPEISPGDFFLRQSYIQSGLNLVDHFISPSAFLRDRYVAWGIPSQRMSVIENFIRDGSIARKTARSSPPGPLRVGFFGQISKLKGVTLLLRCAKFLQAERPSEILIYLNGDYTNQPVEFQREFIEVLSDAADNVVHRGPYRQSEVDSLMDEVDAVVVPSIWWENSPVVIQEAFRNRKPVICSDIGGMAEKVRDGVDGIHFRTGDSDDLGRVLLRLRDDGPLLRKLSRTVGVRSDKQSVLRDHLDLYQNSIIQKSR